jgi:hypothetical protein
MGGIVSSVGSSFLEFPHLRSPLINRRREFRQRRASSRIERLGGLLDGLSAAPAAGWLLGWRLSDQFRHPHRRNELFHSMIVEIDRRPFRIRLGHNAYAVLFMPYCLTFYQNLHESSFKVSVNLKLQP